MVRGERQQPLMKALGLRGLAAGKRRGVLSGAHAASHPAAFAPSAIRRAIRNLFAVALPFCVIGCAFHPVWRCHAVYLREAGRGASRRPRQRWAQSSQCASAGAFLGGLWLSGWPPCSRRSDWACRARAARRAVSSRRPVQGQPQATELIRDLILLLRSTSFPVALCSALRKSPSAWISPLICPPASIRMLP